MRRHTQERKAQNLSMLSGVIDLVRVLSIRSDPIRSDLIRSDPIRSNTVQSDPVRSDPIRSDPIRVLCIFKQIFIKTMYPCIPIQACVCPYVYIPLWNGLENLILTGVYMGILWAYTGLYRHTRVYRFV